MLYLNFSVKCIRQICAKMVTFLCSAYLGGHFYFHSKGKNQFNIRLLHLDNCYNKLISRNWKKILLALYGGKYPLMHVALYICNEMTWYTFWEQNDHEKGKLFCKRIRSKTDKSLITATHTFFLSLT